LLKHKLIRIGSTKKYLILLTFFVVFLLSTRLTNSAIQVIPGWYGVEQWEIDVCNQWAGSEEAQGGASTQGEPTTLSRTTVSLQAKKTVYNIENQSNLYESSWYLEPIGNDIDYQVHLIDSQGIRNKIGEGTATKTEAAKGYYADYATNDYQFVEIDYGISVLTVPVVFT